MIESLVSVIGVAIGFIVGMLIVKLIMHKGNKKKKEEEKQ